MSSSLARITRNRTRALTRPAPDEGCGLFLHHPLIDLFFICGGWLLLLVPLHAALNGGGPTISPYVQTLVLIGLYLISQPHSAATLFKLYGDRENRNSHPLVAYALPPALLIVLAAAFAFPVVARIEATLYVILALHHIMAQCYGVAIMYCARAKVVLSKIERTLLQTIMWTAVAAAAGEQLSISYPRHTLLGIDLFLFNIVPPEIINALHIVTAIAVVILAAVQAERWIWHKPMLPFPAAMTMLTAVTLLTLWNTQNNLVWVFVPPFFHGCQYMAVIMSSFAKQAKTAAPNMTASQVREFSAIRLTELFIVGLILFLGIPKLLSFSGASFALCSALMFFAVNLHHFAADACIWKLRDPRVRRSLT
ncbi:MAG: hypothetical protein JSS83_04630 [Cyanobacteria bacterium SZAS LIN-3]|nr:hypothetical protein [Cyanobacteria bacterium SZAS LIN-3]